jgi:hypothetical protein
MDLSTNWLHGLLHTITTVVEASYARWPELQARIAGAGGTGKSALFCLHAHSALCLLVCRFSYG